MEGGRERRGRVSANDGALVNTPAGGILACAGGDGVVRLLDNSGTEVRSSQRSGRGSNDMCCLLLLALALMQGFESFNELNQSFVTCQFKYYYYYYCYNYG